MCITSDGYQQLVCTATLVGVVVFPRGRQHLDILGDTTALDSSPRHASSPSGQRADSSASVDASVFSAFRFFVEAKFMIFGIVKFSKVMYAC